MNVNAFAVLMPALAAATHNDKWQTRLGALQLLTSVATQCTNAIRVNLPDLMPVVSDLMNDIKPVVGEAAYECMTAICAQASNKDLEPMIPVVISAIKNPSEVSECVYTVSATTFVQPVEAAALSIMAPVLNRALAEGITAVKRKAAVIIENMCKMVVEPEHAVPFCPLLLPALERTANETSDPECRQVAARAHQVLTTAAAGKSAEESYKANPAEVEKGLLEIVGGPIAADLKPLVDHVVTIAAQLITVKNFEHSEWFMVRGGARCVLGPSRGLPERSLRSCSTEP